MDQMLKEIKNTNNLEELLIVEQKIFGRKNGWLTNQMKELKDLSVEQKSSKGQELNKIKQELEKEFNLQKEYLENKDDEIKLENFYLDITEPANKKYKIGKLHPLTKFLRDVEDYFIGMGFLVVDQPELETDFWNFQSLNVAENHPARDMQDTFYIKTNNNEKYVLRTQVSGAWTRAINKYKTDIENGEIMRFITSGRVFRNEDQDARHEHTFHQIDWCVIGKDISLANLLDMYEKTISFIFGKKLNIRIRPGYFPFVEPGFELDVECPFCEKNKHCSVCSNSKWIEIMPGGPIHPEVIKNCGLDPKIYNGYAFDLGVSRMIMLKYNINDIRYLHDSTMLKVL